jgi:hypothetical protein
LLTVQLILLTDILPHPGFVQADCAVRVQGNRCEIRDS